MLIPESKSEKEMAYLRQFKKWLKTRPERDQALYCEHGRYVGYKASISFMCKECKGSNEH